MTTLEQLKKKEPHYLASKIGQLNNDLHYHQRRLRLCRHDDAIKNIVLSIEKVKFEKNMHEEALTFVKQS